MRQKWFIGVDAGGSKTEVLIQFADGSIVTKTSLPASLHNMPLELAVKHVCEPIMQLVEKHGIESKAEVACIGWAGLDTEKDRQRLISQFQNNQLIPARKIIIVNDAYIGLRSNKRVKTGMCLIAGTGANCYGLTKDGNEASADGLGYLLGDQGSSFSFGQVLIKRAMEEIDCRQPKTIISDRVISFFELTEKEQLSEMIYSTEDPVKKIASLAKLMNDSDLVRNPIVLKMIEDLIDAMIMSVTSVMKQLVFPLHKNITLVLIGGLFSQQKLITTPLKQKLISRYPRLSLIRPNKPPVYGALNIAQGIEFQKVTLPLLSLIVEY